MSEIVRDRLYRFDTDDSGIQSFKCPSCNWSQTSLYILAETEEEANKIRKEGGGLCGDCTCQNLIDTHADV